MQRCHGQRFGRSWHSRRERHGRASCPEGWECVSVLQDGRGELCVGQGSRQGGGICVRVSTQGSTVAVTWCTQAPSDGVEVSTFESQPALSRADTSCSAEERRAEEAQCVFESNPTARVADVSSTTVEEGTSGEPSVFESTLAPRFAAMRCSEEVVAENAGNCTFESCPTKSSAAVTWETRVTEASDGQSVLENQPLVSRVDTRWPRRRRTTRAPAIR